MTPLFYDNGSTGHHPGYIGGIIAAAVARGIEFMVASVERPDSLTSNDRWIPVEDKPLRSVLANRRELSAAAESARESGADLLVDLYLDKLIWAVDAARTLRSRVHVLHHGEQYDAGSRTGMAAARTRYLRRKVRRMARRGSVFVVHNQRTAEILGGDVPTSQMLLAGYPVRTLMSRPPQHTASHPTLLFVGGGRHEKGLDLLLAALAEDPDIASLRVIGRQPPGVRERFEPRYPKVAVEWIDRFVTDQELWEAYATSQVAVLPYRAEFGLHGGPSSVLLETLSTGIPVVTTPALASQLPADYDGAIVAETDSPPAISSALREALHRLEGMSSAALERGPGFVAENHSYDAYLSSLLRAAEMAKLI